MTTIDYVAYRTIDGITLLARLYRPNTDGPVKWMIDVHGGAWGSGDRRPAASCRCGGAWEGTVRRESQ